MGYKGLIVIKDLTVCLGVSFFFCASISMHIISFFGGCDIKITIATARLPTAGALHDASSLPQISSSPFPSLLAGSLPTKQHVWCLYTYQYHRRPICLPGWSTRMRLLHLHKRRKGLRRSQTPTAAFHCRVYRDRMEPRRSRKWKRTVRNICDWGEINLRLL